MEPFVEVKKVRPLLLEIKNQYIQVALRNQAGKWSEEYYHIESCDPSSTPNDVLFVMVRAPSTDRLFIIDVNSITGVKLNKYLKWNGQLHSSFEIFQSKNLETLKVRILKV
jgi:hypothetical protein